MGEQVRLNLLIHLRLHFQLLLAPIFLWGFLLAGGRLGALAIPAFTIFHVFLYGGATAFNSAYDRDEGPVGGLSKPPPVSGGLLPFSLAILFSGWALSSLIGWPFFIVYGSILALALGYSHPLLRWKSGPWTSLGTIFVGQGVLGFLGGWTAAGGEISGVATREGILGVAGAALTVAGFYPLSQLFQIQEDRARGDRTPVVAWGANRCLRLSQIILLAGGVSLMLVVFSRYGLAETALAGVSFAALLAAIERWRGGFQPEAVQVNFRYAMKLNAATALCLVCYMGWHLLPDAR